MHHELICHQKTW